MPHSYFALMLALVIAAAVTVWGVSLLAPEWALPGLLVVTLGASLALHWRRR
jgi:hypothetical protein